MLVSTLNYIDFWSQAGTSQHLDTCLGHWTSRPSGRDQRVDGGEMRLSLMSDVFAAAACFVPRRMLTWYFHPWLSWSLTAVAWPSTAA